MFGEEFLKNQKKEVKMLDSNKRLGEKMKVIIDLGQNFIM